MQVKLQNLWYGNELSEYGRVQSTVLADGRRYLTVTVRRLIVVSIYWRVATSESGSYDAGVTCVSRVISSRH